MTKEIEKLIAEADRAYEDVFNVAQRERDLIRRLADALGEIAELHALCDDRLWSVEKHAERMESGEVRQERADGE